mgnify:CR=1 FL=1
MELNREPTQADIKEYVRQALCRMLNDALELNDLQLQRGEDPAVVKATEEDIMEDFQMMLDWFRLTEYNKQRR